MFHQTGMGAYSPNSLEAEYKDILTKHFIRNVSNIEEVDFAGERVQTTNHINDWIKQQTKNKIPKLFSEPLDRKMVQFTDFYFCFYTRHIKWGSSFYFPHTISKIVDRSLRVKIVIV